MGLIRAKWLPNELLSTSLTGNIEGGTDGSPRNGCFAHISAHLQHFLVRLNKCHGYCVNAVHKVLQHRVTKKTGNGVYVQDRHCGDS